MSMPDATLPELTLPELVRNGTMSEQIAAVLWSVAAERRWFIVVAKPRKAGKSAVSNAALQFAPPGTPIHRLSGEIEEMDRLARNPDGGYLVVGEISPERPQRYIWGEAVSALFRTLNAGYALNTTLHASSVKETFDQICHQNKVSDEDAGRIEYMVYVERFGGDPSGSDDDDLYWRRVSGLYEIAGVRDGIPDARLLSRWVTADDRFAQEQGPQLLDAGENTLATRARRIRELADTGRTGLEDIESLRGPAT
jgi:hypothetical protein